MSTALRTSSRLPSLFIAHGGGPMPLLDAKDPLPPVWRRHIAELFPAEPTAASRGLRYSDIRAIAVVSAHYEVHDELVHIGGAEQPKMIYDYSGFPKESYSFVYPARGAPDVAVRCGELLREAGIPFKIDHGRGFDHGVFVPLMVMFPHADIPVVPVSIFAHQDPAKHAAVGKALSKLRDEGVFVLGSGLSSHNFDYFFGSKKPKKALVAQDFHEKLNSYFSSEVRVPGAPKATNAVEQPKAEMREMFNYLSWPNAEEAQAPGRADHFMPFFVCMGSSQYYYDAAPESAQHPEVFWSGSMMGCAVSHFLFRS